MIKHKKNLKCEIGKNYLLIQKKFKLSFANNLRQKIRIGIICYSIKNGGVERLITLLINYLYKVKIFNLYLFTLIKETNEYIIEGNI
jgi:citrate lyase synthetase